MNSRTAGSSRHSRPRLWSALLSLLVALSLLVPPSQLCALMESAPGHLHGAAGHSHKASHSHEAAGQHEGEHEHAQSAHHHQSRLAFAPAESPNNCCGQSEAIPLIAASASRFAAPHQASAPVAHAPAILPRAGDIFALTACHGRDGPTGNLPRPLFLSALLLGRAPPVSA